MVDGEHAGFPDLAFFGLAVAAEAIDEVVIAAELLAEGHAGRGGETLAEGTGGLEDAREVLADGRVALQAGAELTEGRELRHREVAGAGQFRIINRSEVSGGEDEHILSLAVAAPGGRVVLHHVGIQDREDVCAGHGTARMPGFRQADHPENIPADLRGEVFQLVVGMHSSEIIVTNANLAKKFVSLNAGTRNIKPNTLF